MKRKNCLLCEELLTVQRIDAKFCTGTCRAKYAALKKKGELNGFQLKKDALIYNPEIKTEKNEGIPPDKPIYKTVDIMDLEPLWNLVGEVDLSKIESKEENVSSELNEGNQSKEESKQETPEEEKEEPEKEIILPEKYILKAIDSKNPEYTFYAEQLNQCRKDIKTFEAEIVNLNGRITEEKNKDGSGYVLAGAGLGLGGSLLYNHFQDIPSSKAISSDKLYDKNGKELIFLKSRKMELEKRKKPVPEKNSGLSIWEILLLGAVGTGAGYIGKAATEDSREAGKAQKIKEYHASIRECQAFLQELKIMEGKLAEELAKHPVSLNKEVPQLNPDYIAVKKQIEEKKQKKEQLLKEKQAKNQSTTQNINQSENNESNQGKDLSGIDNPDKETELSKENNLDKKEMKKKKNLETDKILSMDAISKLKKELLNFNGKWEDFFGKPQTNFFCIIHGGSGHGKSHFAMQFGKYLAERFGNVLYISGEEGFASTFQKKIKTLGANVDRYYGTEIKTGAEILTEVPNQFHFIIIDSLNNMGIEPKLMQAIRDKYNKSAIIGICQSTKDGKMRGSEEFTHDTDTVIKVLKGIATTTKNRFGNIHQDFDVFSVYRKKTDDFSSNKKKKDDNLDDSLDNIIK